MRRLAIVAALVLLVAGAAGAAQTVFTNQAAWEAAVPGFGVENFNDAVLNFGISVASANGVISLGNWSDKVVDGTQTTTWFFAEGRTAWGAQVWDLTPGGTETGLYVWLDGAPAPSPIANSTAGTFWGVTSTVPFYKVWITTATGFGTETYKMDDMVYSAIPAPGAILLGMIGTGVVGWLRSRRSL